MGVDNLRNRLQILMSINRIRVSWGNRERWGRIHGEVGESESTDIIQKERRIENLSRGCRIPESELPNWVRVHHEWPGRPSYAYGVA